MDEKTGPLETTDETTGPFYTRQESFFSFSFHLIINIKQRMKSLCFITFFPFFILNTGSNSTLNYYKLVFFRSCKIFINFIDD